MTNSLVPTYVIFDPYEPALEVRRLQDGKYVLQEPSPEGRYWIPELELFLGIWHGTRLGLTIHWLRWWDSEGAKLKIRCRVCLSQLLDG